MDVGILPVKSLSAAKSRLRADFGDEGAHAVARALLEDALALCASVGFLRWWVVSDDEQVLERARGAGFAAVADGGTGLNEAVERAVEAAMGAGATSATVIPADVPLAFSGDLQDLLDTGATSDIVVVPATRDGGTNGLYLSPPDVLPPRFGPGSLTAHLKEAERLGLRCTILNLPRLSLDVDTTQDVHDVLAQARHPSRTVEVLRELNAGKP